MSLHVFTTEEKITEVERLIRVDPRNEVLKAVAADLRGRLRTAPSVAEAALLRRITSVKLSKTIGGDYDPVRLVELGQETVGRWPVVKQALERFGAEVEEQVHG